MTDIDFSQVMKQVFFLWIMFNLLTDILKACKNISEFTTIFFANSFNKLRCSDCLNCIPEQENPDGNFTTCPYPNPEIREALDLGLKLSEKVGADLLLATDPDSDLPTEVR